MDQIANMINTIKNGNRAGHETVSVSFSKIKQAIADCLVKEGYLASVSKKTSKGFPVLVLGLAFDASGSPKVQGVDRVSKSSCRIYAGVKDIKPVKSGFGAMIMSTPKGIMTGKQARKELVGGEVLFKIW